MSVPLGTVRVRWSNGREEVYDSYEDALAACLAEWPEAEIGHDGDLTEGGDRTLVWRSEDDSVDDDGARAVASIEAEARS